VAAVIRYAVVALALGGACDTVQGLGGTVPPLASFMVELTGDVAAVAPPGDGAPNLQVALVWGAQWLPEPLCALPAESPEAAAVLGSLDAPGPGCRDPFGFVPLRVAATAPIAPGEPATLDVVAVPAGDVVVGDLTGRAAYASFIVYDDRDGDGTLAIVEPSRVDSGDAADPETATSDVVYGGSFVSMTQPDQRLGYREGAFDAAAAFYPRAGCAAPPVGFSVLAASGFTPDDAAAATRAGTLPEEQDLSRCAAAPAGGAAVSVGVQAPDSVRELACTERTTDSSVTYREPPGTAPDLSGRLQACVHLPSFGAAASPVTELIVTGVVDPDAAHPRERCVGLTHYILTGCETDPGCTAPAWDLRSTPPAWWPCSP
jgi:hypothetical protein